MKTAISIPDKIFAEAEEVARRLGLSRSELYARAVEAYLDRLREENVREKLNEAFRDEPDTGLDPVLGQLQWQALRRAVKDDEW